MPNHLSWGGPLSIFAALGGVTNAPDSDPNPPSPRPRAPEGWPGGVWKAGTGASEQDPGLTDGSGWSALIEELERAGRFVNAEGAPANDRDRSEGWRHLSSLLRMGIGELLEPADPDRPRFRWSDGNGKWGLDCSDALYCQAPVRAGAVYRVRGQRGSVHFMGLQLIGRMAALSDLDADQLEVDSQGRFELIVGGEQRPGNWLALPEGASTLIVRQFFYDWDSEIPATFEIERIDDGEVRPPPNLPNGAIVQQLGAIGRFVHDNTEWWARISHEKREVVNTFPNDAGGLGNVGAGSQKYQSFGIGYFQLKDDEGLLVEVTPPKAKYWSLHLGNYWMESMDFANHQSSLNGHQAILDPDGVFRAVVSRADPGVPNWLDTTGLREGSMIYRWNQADGNPIPRARVIALDRLREALPASTGNVTPEQRSAAVERRRQHIRRRYGRPL
ncbi:DUF1214 domain-containing protein [Myxococcota bacterium]|nr:DUF1214 domain-containing protein [Myxococcota bacterium]